MRSVKLSTLMLVWGMWLVVNTAAAETVRPLKICTDNANWRPFVYQEQGQLMGLHIDTIGQVLSASGVEYEFIPVPWKRCLKGAEKGSFDGIATASYNTERAQYMWYPEDAASAQSDWRVGQVEYNIIVHSESAYAYGEDWNLIPQPIRVPRDYSIGHDLRSQNIAVDDSSIHDIQNLKRLVREKKGSVVALPSIAEWANQQDEFKGQIRLIPEPLRSKSYFLSFSKQGLVGLDQAKIIWDQIRSHRERTALRVDQSSENWPQ